MQKFAAKLKPLNIAFWEAFKEGDGWCFRSTTPIQPNGELQNLASRSHSKFLKSVKALLPAAQVTTVILQVMACWSYPLELLTGNRYRMTDRHLTGSSERHLPNPGSSRRIGF